MPANNLYTKLKANNDTGFAVQPENIGGRFVNRDGSFNLRKQGLPWLRRVSFYSTLLEFSWLRFLALIVLFYLVANLFFTALYLLVGTHQLTGFLSVTNWGRAKEVFYFSTQTFTTVGYGRINPIADGADLLASIETMTGWLFFALVTGLLYGRFTRPRAFIAFSGNALISPYQGGTALMFRMVPYKNLHHLTDVRLVVNLSLQVVEAGKAQYKFFELALERSRIDMFNMNWTVVHPINDQSPLYSYTMDDISAADVELLVQVSGFDPVFSNQVLQRTSYTHHEVVWGAKFQPMFKESADGLTTILELNKLDAFDVVTLPQTAPAPKVIA